MFSFLKVLQVPLLSILKQSSSTSQNDTLYNKVILVLLQFQLWKRLGYEIKSNIGLKVTAKNNYTKHLNLASVINKNKFKALWKLDQ